MADGVPGVAPSSARMSVPSDSGAPSAAVVDPLRLLAAIERVHAGVRDRRHRSVDDALAEALPPLLELTGAVVAFFCHVDATRGEPPEIVLGPTDATDADDGGLTTLWVFDLFHDTLPAEGLPRPLAGLGTSTEPIILGYEPLLTAIDNFMTLPIAIDGSLVAFVGLVNRAGGFDLELYAQLQPFLSACRTLLGEFESREKFARMQVQLERAERKFQAFMDASKVAGYLVDEERRVRWASAAFSELLGIDPHEAVGRHEEQVLPTSLAARAALVDEEVRETKGVVDVLEPTVGEDGRLRWWKGAKFPVEGPDGEPLIGGVAIDVTEAVGLSETVRERESELAQAQELGRLGRWTWVVERDRIEWDIHFERLCGLPSMDDHDLGTLLGLIHPEDVEPTRTALERSVRTGANRFTFEHRLLVGGEVRELTVVARVRREGDSGAVVSAVAQDVTERRVLERARRALEGKAHEFDSLSVLTGSLAREFDDLWMGVLGNAGIALDELDPDSLAAACVQDIEGAAERAAQLTRQMLAFSGRPREEPESVELSSLIARCAEAIHGVIFDAVNVRLSLHPALPTIQADVAQLRQLVLSLARNGSEAMGERGGELTLATGIDEFDEPALAGLAPGCDIEPGIYAWLSVRDTGGGVEPSLVHRIFEPFFSTKFTSRGLGLAAVLGIVRAHDGGLLVDNRPGQGLAIRALFPPEGRAGESSESWASPAVE